MLPACAGDSLSMVIVLSKAAALCFSVPGHQICRTAELTPNPSCDPEDQRVGSQVDAALLSLRNLAQRPADLTHASVGSLATKYETRNLGLPLKKTEV